MVSADAAEPKPRVREKTGREAPKTDGRKRRWEEHKIARREELVDGTLEAIRRRGSNAGMDEIAAEIGVSKTVLYRYFADKSDLTRAVTMRYVEVVLAPKIYGAISTDDDEYTLVRSTITAYVHTVDADPEVYRYIMGNGSGADQTAIAESEQLFAGIVATIIGERARSRGMDSGGAVPWGYAIVGAIQLATHWWITNKSMSADDLIDYLTMMTWSAIDGLFAVGGSPAKFRAASHTLRGDLPPAADGG
ncbi:MAG: TetR/AcrR family transcriptional regulator [Mycobacteriaceae bacterium]|nr:TetR/AcrR family transcriptional regulator [Mycobacteriaceae bacterium]